MNKHLRLIILSTIGIIAVIGLLFWLTFSYPEFRNINKIEFKEVKGEQLLADLNVNVENNNFYSILAHDLNFTFFYGDEQIGTGTSIEKKRIKKGTTAMDVDGKFDLEKLIKIYPNVYRKDSIVLDYSVTGKFSFLSLEQTAEMSTKVSVKEVLNAVMQNFSQDDDLIAFDHFRIAEANLTQTRFYFEVKLYNKSPVDFVLKDAAFDIYSEQNGTKIGKWHLEDEVGLPKLGKNAIPVDVTINNFSAASSFINTLTSRKIKYYVTGNVAFEIEGNAFELPFETGIKVDPINGKFEYY